VRIKIFHEVAYAFEPPARSVTQAMRIMPRDCESQVVVSWRIEPSVDGRLRSQEDAFGNLVHHFQADGPFEHIQLRVEGVVETTDVTGFVRGAAEPMPDRIFLRDTALTRADEAMALFARKIGRVSQSPLEQLHALMDALHAEMRMDDEAFGDEKAASAFARRKGSAVDVAHIFCGCARELGIPARFVAGYAAIDGALAQRHAWIEAGLAEYGWIGFDPGQNQCPTDRHVRVAVGIDHDDAAPFRTARTGGGADRAQHTVAVAAIDQ
jgi:transglutaminase-like putative cysteine protease